DQDGRIIEYGITRFRGDRMELVFENELLDTLNSKRSSKL
ncbi:hypothetical protein M595_4242, partial [Lyngbya aestuarii BL J]